MLLPLFNSLLILLCISLVVTTVCQRIKLPTVIGYILVGLLVGPYTIGIFSATENIQLLAQFGIVFLMFTVGLEFSLPQLLKLKKDVIGFGGSQVLLTIAITVMIGLLIGLNKTQSFIIGAIVAMSSTAIVMKQLKEQGELNSRYSQHALGILLLQDLAVIPILIMLPSLNDVGISAFFTQLLLSLLKGVFAIVAILFIGRRILQPLFYHIAQSRSLEQFTLATLFVTLGSAWVTSYFGLSMALGAFLAGMMLGETEFRHQIKTDIRPFKDVLLGFFFITIGMQFNPAMLLIAWEWIVLLLLALIAFKVILIIYLGIFFTRSRTVAIQTGLILAQGGEFGFAILLEALNHELIPADYGQVILSALLLSMATAPLIIKHHQKIAHFFYPYPKEKEKQDSISLSSTTSELSNHIILCGYGRVGQNIGRFLEKAKLTYIALDLDPERIKNARLAGDLVFYADATNYEVLQSAHIHKARAIVVSFINPLAAHSIVEMVRKHHKQLPIIVRSHDESETHSFYEKGATEVISDVLEASLMLASHILLLMKVPFKEVYQWIEESRQNRYDLLRMVFPGQDPLSLEEGESSKEGLSVVTLTKKAFATNQILADLPAFEKGVKITTIRRGHHRFSNPTPDFKLEAGDIIVLYGDLDFLKQAQNILFRGK